MKDLKQSCILYTCCCMLMICIGLPMSLSAAISYTQTFGENAISTQLITAPNGQVYTSFYGQDIIGSGEPGQPEMPYKVVRFLVPEEATDFSVTVNGIEGISTYTLAYPLYPVQKAISINDFSEELFTYANSTAYKALSTEFKATVLEEMRIEGRYHVVSVGLWPCAWTGNENKLEICNTMQITLDYKENSSRLKKKKESSSIATNFVNIADIVVNPESPVQKSNEFGDLIDLNYPDTILPRYYIISEKKLLTACEDLATWKTQKGYTVIRKAIEDIYNDTRYKVGTNGIVDEAMSLRKYLHDEFEEYGTFFCLLVGDHKTILPIRKVYVKNESKNTSFNGDHYIPTDTYFANLAEDKWNVVRNNLGIYCNSTNYNDTAKDDNLDYNPYIYVGRLLCHSEEEINNYTSKLILYESNPGRGNSDYLDKSLITMQYDAILYNTSTTNVISEMTKTFGSVECLRDTVYANNTLIHCFPTGEIMLNKINEYGYCSLNGHGEPTTIACSGKNHEYDTWEYIKALESYQGYWKESNIPYQCDNCGLDLMTNYDKPSVIYSMACTTTPFDIYAEFDVPHTMASSFICGGNYGGVAYLGNTRSGYWPYSCYIERQFLREIKNNSIIGIAEAMSKVNYTTSSYVHASHNLIGDPELRLWLNSPSELNVSASWEDDFKISGFDANGCTVVQNDGEGNIKRIKVVQRKPQAPVGYPSSGRMQALGIFKDGFLPQVQMNCRNDNLTNCNKRFIVRTAQVGLTNEKSVFIGANAIVDIKAVNEILTGQGLSIEKDGKLSLRCDKTIEISGSEVNSGGELRLSAEKVILSDGFTVKSGGTLSVGIN